jgi:hypothetical protein
MEWRAGMESLSRSTIKRPALGRAQAGGRSQARGHARAGGGQPDRHSNISQKGTRLGNWLTREKARELLAVPDRSTLKGKRDYVILALLGSPQNTDIKARLGVCASIKSMIYSRALRTMCSFQDYLAQSFRIIWRKCFRIIWRIRHQLVPITRLSRAASTTSLEMR